MKTLKTLSTIETFKHLSDMLLTEDRLFFSRFGDVDFLMMREDRVGDILGRSNKTLLTEVLRAEMLEAFSIVDKNYVRCHVSNMEFEDGMDILNLPGYKEPGKKGEHVWNWWNNQAVENTPFLEDGENIFYNACTFYMYATFRQSILAQFIADHISHKKKMIVGCRDPEIMRSMFGNIDYYVKTPEINSYSEIDIWWPNVLKNVDDVEIILPFTGQSSRVLNKRLWKLDIEVQSIDTGSWIDPYCGVVNRGWTKRAIPYIVGQ